MFQSHGIFRIFDGYAHPDMTRGFVHTVASSEISNHERTSLSQYLISVPTRCFHRIEYGIDKVLGHLFVEEVAHRIYKDATRLSPSERLRETLWSQCEVEASFEWMILHPSEPL